LGSEIVSLRINYGQLPGGDKSYPG
jgi:hypothetical protein